MSKVHQISRAKSVVRSVNTTNQVSVSRVYADVLSTLPSEWSDVDSFEPNIVSHSKFEIAEWIGTGKYSDVFIGYYNEKRVCLKVLKPLLTQKIYREIKILTNLKDAPNTIKILAVTCNPLTKQYTIVMEFFDTPEFVNIYPKFKEVETKICFFQLLRALQFAHSHGIMHRDLKPQNILYDPESSVLKVIDWGLADFYRPTTSYNNHVASKHFKAIELLLDYRYYDYSIDIWGLGVTLFMVIIGKNPFAATEKDHEIVVKIVSIFGYQEFSNYIHKYNISISHELDALLPKTAKKKNFYAMFPREADKEAIDLIEHCLRYDHQERISVDEAIKHPYFDSIRRYKLPT